VVNAGNKAGTKGGQGKKRVNVNGFPALFAADGFLLIVVGATDFNGATACFS
jgi:hypothetical protein